VKKVRDMSDLPRGQNVIAQAKPGIYTHNLVVCFYEFLGTAMLVLGYNFTAAGLAVGFNLFVGILMASKVSGGMFNPAVTFAVYTAKGQLW
jgi:glycerol uptake facilitator-like aquaporin